MFDFMSMMLGLGVLGFIFGIVAVGFAIFFFVFWLMMLIDCIKRKFKDDTEKVIWILVLIFTYFIGALIYYFIVKRKNKR